MELDFIFLMNRLVIYPLPSAMNGVFNSESYDGFVVLVEREL